MNNYQTQKHNDHQSSPLAARLRPRELDQFVGHEKILGQGTALRRAIIAGHAGSLILWGPPGVGKTTLAYLIAGQIQAKVERVSAVSAGVKDLRLIIKQADQWRKLGSRTLLIVDEIHRFNKAQQDVLLPHVEDGLITLVGATTENPYFEVISALVSRVEVVKLDQLTNQDIITIVHRAGFKLSTTASAAIAKLAGGDARRALNILERASLATKQTTTITAAHIKAIAEQVTQFYDQRGTAHYDTISAFIKSMRGSDVDAALFYLFRMIMSGEDPKFIVRRMLIFASEDIGNADPHSLMVASSAAHALTWVGLPEAEYALAHCAVYLSAAPKSNRVKIARQRAKQDVTQYGNAMPPPHITNAPFEDMKKFKQGVSYKYPPDYSGGLVQQQYRPDAVQTHIYYEPTTSGFEKEVKKRIDHARAVLQGKFKPLS